MSRASTPGPKVSRGKVGVDFAAVVDGVDEPLSQHLLGGVEGQVDGERARVRGGAVRVALGAVQVHRKQGAAAARREPAKGSRAQPQSVSHCPRCPSR